MTLAEYRKLIVTVVGFVVTLLGLYGTELDPELVVAITGVLTGVGVWFFPNQRKTATPPRR